MGEQNVLREGALFEKKGANGDDSKKDSPGELEEQDKLSFKDYARVLVKRLSTPDTWPVSLGIYAQWGAGKVRGYFRPCSLNQFTCDTLALMR